MKKMLKVLAAIMLISTKVIAEDVVIIGDSLTVGSEKYIRYFLPDAVIDAKVGRKFQEVVGVIKSLETDEKLKSTVVISLSTNSQISIEELLTVVDYLLEKGKKVILVNTKVPRKWEDINNYNIYLLKSIRPQVKIVDWKRVSEHYCKTYNCFRPDGYHLTEVGSYIYSYLIYYYVKNSASD